MKRFVGTGVPGQGAELASSIAAAISTGSEQDAIENEVVKNASNCVPEATL